MDCQLLGYRACAQKAAFLQKARQKLRGLWDLGKLRLIDRWLPVQILDNVESSRLQERKQPSIVNC
jgi:hypothetical protein